MLLEVGELLTPASELNTRDTRMFKTTYIRVKTIEYIRVLQIEVWTIALAHHLRWQEGFANPSVKASKKYRIL